jgi:hypothetical protein
VGPQCETCLLSLSWLLVIVYWLFDFWRIVYPCDNLCWYLQFIGVAQPVFMLRAEDVMSPSPGPEGGVNWPVTSGGGGKMDYEC